MGIAAVRDGKLAIAVCIMHACVLFAGFIIIAKSSSGRAVAEAKNRLPCLKLSAGAGKLAWWTGLLTVASLYATPVLIYIYIIAHISLFKSLLHHAVLAVVGLLCCYLLLPWWYNSLLWPASLQLASQSNHKQKLG